MTDPFGGLSEEEAEELSAVNLLDEAINSFIEDVVEGNY